MAFLNNDIYLFKGFAFTHNHGVYWRPVISFPGSFRGRGKLKLHLHNCLVSITFSYS